MHEIFLLRLAAHPAFKEDYNFQTFLEYEGDVSYHMTITWLIDVVCMLQLRVRSKNTREKFGSFWKGFSKSMDENIILKNHKDVDPWFEQEKKFLTDYHIQ